MSSGIETNKIVGAILTALLVTVGIGHFGAALFDSGGHGEAELAYPVSAGSTEVEPAGPEIIPTVLPLLADASPADGEAQFGACKGCHNAAEGGPNTVGPNLWGVVGRPVASHEGYSYSDAMASFGGDWTYDRLNEFLFNPREDISGTKMTFAGLPDVQVRANVIAYLRTLSNDPVPLPTQEEIDSAVAAQQADAGGDETAEPGDEAADDGAAPDESAAPTEDSEPEATEPEATTDEADAAGDESTEPADEAADEPEATDETAAPAEDSEPEATEPEATEPEATTDEAAAPDEADAAGDESTEPAEETVDEPAATDETAAPAEDSEPEAAEPEASTDESAAPEEPEAEDSTTPEEPAAEETAEEPVESDG